MTQGRFTTNKAKIQYWCEHCKKDVHLYGSSKKKGDNYGYRTCNGCGYIVIRKVF